jgi:serine-type D-Ala-D-Ala carboxypeptidase (penicillin-binding protein 5/6)
LLANEHGGDEKELLGAGDMTGWSRRPGNNGRRARSARRRRRAPALIVATLAVVLLAAVSARVATESVPPYRIKRLLAATVPIRGARPKIAWPTEGEAAVEVLGVGSLGRSGISAAVPIASIAKVMTAYLTLREHPLRPGASGFTITITPEEVEEERTRAALDQSVVPVAAGETLTERQALQALLLPSANNVAALLAEYDAGSQAAFVARMNAAARRLGMSSTHYTDPSGYEDTTVSTAGDLLELARAVIDEPAFAEIVDERQARLPVAGVVENYNGLVGQEGYVGIKTGSDSAAGGCLLFAKRVRVAGRTVTILGVVLGQRGGSYVPAALASAQRLGNSAAAALRTRIVLPAGTHVLRARGVDGKGVEIVTARPLRAVGWGGLRVGVVVSAQRPRSSSLSVGEPVGTVSLGGRRSPGEKVEASVWSRAVAAGALPEPSLGWRLQHVL